MISSLLLCEEKIKKTVKLSNARFLLLFHRLKVKVSSRETFGSSAISNRIRASFHVTQLTAISADIDDIVLPVAISFVLRVITRVVVTVGDKLATK